MLVNMAYYVKKVLILLKIIHAKYLYATKLITMSFLSVALYTYIIIFSIFKAEMHEKKKIIT